MKGEVRYNLSENPKNTKNDPVSKPIIFLRRHIDIPKFSTLKEGKRLRIVAKFGTMSETSNYRGKGYGNLRNHKTVAHQKKNIRIPPGAIYSQDAENRY